MTPLMAALEGARDEFAMVLIEEGASLSKENRRGERALEIAVRKSKQNEYIAERMGNMADLIRKKMIEQGIPLVRPTHFPIPDMFIR
jgi:hypothetical protein